MSPKMRPREARTAPKRRVDYRAPAFLIDDVALEFDLDPDATNTTSTLAFRRNPAAQGKDRAAKLVLDGEHQEHLRVALDGRRLDGSEFELGASGLALLDPPDSGTLQIVSTIAPSRNAALEGLYISSGVFCTQCEPEGFRRITYFPDRPDVLARYRVTLRAERKRYPTLLSNGNLVASGSLDKQRHYATWHDPFPKPTYLFALVAGDLAALEDTFVTVSGRRVTLRIFSTPRNVARCTHAMDSLKRAMRWDEARFGREYDLDTFMIFCADDFNFGAMENKGLNIFNSRLVLADGAMATDADFNAIEGVVAHEYFHNWTGNRVTCRDWFQLSLKEGLTVFRDQEFSSEQGSRAVERIGAVEYLRREQFAEDASPLRHSVRPDEYREINNFYTATVYEKGAELIRMQHTLLGPERFRRGMDLYFERHDGRAITCDDFVQSMQDGSGVDLTQFRAWYSQSGTPVIAARGHYDEHRRSYVLDVEQRLSDLGDELRPDPLHVPLAIGLVDASGADMPMRLAGEPAASATTRVLELRQRVHRFEFVDVEERPVPSLLRGFSAPVKLLFDYSDEALALLASHDSDAVNRWDAAQRLFANAILQLAKAHRDGASLELPRLLVGVFRTLLMNESGDPALRALALAMPDTAYVAELETSIDADGVTAACEHLRKSLAHALREDFEHARRIHRPTGPYAPTPAQVGARSLANVCLRYLGAMDDERVHALVRSQYEAADNMTDVIAALDALRDSRSTTREALYAHFENRWRDEPLVLDKWFGLQARSLRDDALATVRSLISHPRFNARNPNRVRSLVGAFALANFARFNAIDGSGYAFAAEQVRALDPINPQLAATIAGAFSLWKRFAEPRRTMMWQSLERIARTRELSPDVSEIVARTMR